jgi:tryptophanyl-tRNA synthetase
MNKDGFVVTPWEVQGNIDYSKLIKEFGLEQIGKLPSGLKDNLLFRRKFIFASRDFGRISSAIENKKPFVMMTGLMPSGNMHFGHKLLADQMILYQNLGAKIYITVADIEAYNSRNTNLEELRKIALDQYLVNYIALGLKPKNCDFYFQSMRSKDGKKASAYYSLANRLARHATFNEFRAVYGEIGPGKMASSLLQAADMLHCQLPEFEGKIPTVIPVGSDQDPHIRLARDISQRIKAYDFIQLSSTYHRFLPGLGGGKMSSSDPTSHIALSEDPENVKKLINKYAFSGGQPTLEEHRKKGGNPDIDVSYQYLTYLEEDDKKLSKIYNDYKSGALLSGEMKALAIEKISSFLKKHQIEREKAKKQVDKFLKE